MTKLFLELEFQHKGNKQTKKGLLATNSCGFLGRNGFRKYKLFKCNTEKDKNKNWTDLSSLGQEPTFKSDHRFKFVEGFYLLLHSGGLLRNTYQLSLLKVFLSFFCCILEACFERNIYQFINYQYGQVCLAPV